jgi:hypothetical protein
MGRNPVHGAVLYRPDWRESKHPYGRGCLASMRNDRATVVEEVKQWART